MKYHGHLVVATLTAALAGGACSSDDERRAGSGDSTVVRLVTHESFTLPDEVLATFTTQTGFTVEVIPLGDAGATLNRAILTKDDPLGDVLFGVDSILLSRAVNAELFTRYRSSELDAVPESLRVADDRVTPIDRGDVCVNADTQRLAELGLAVPSTLADLADPKYRGLLVTQDPVSSTPGLAFLLATIDEFGDEWPTFWEALRDNNIAVTPGWSEAYNASYSAGPGAGDRPLMVSYATSPAADGGRSEVVLDSCFGQIEYAGVLAGAANPKGAAALVDFLLSSDAQNAVAGSMYVYPVRQGATVPPEFDVVPEVPSPRSLPAGDIDANREEWIDEWSAIVQG
jgi:thiamine transport system substrate-binding protein